MSPLSPAEGTTNSGLKSDTPKTLFLSERSDPGDAADAASPSAKTQEIDGQTDVQGSPAPPANETPAGQAAFLEAAMMKSKTKTQKSGFWGIFGQEDSDEAKKSALFLSLIHI